MAAVRHLGIVLPPYETTHKVSVAGLSCLSNFMSIWYTDLKIYSYLNLYFEDIPVAISYHLLHVICICLVHLAYETCFDDFITHWQCYYSYKVIIMMFLGQFNFVNRILHIFSGNTILVYIDELVKFDCFTTALILFSWLSLCFELLTLLITQYCVNAISDILQWHVQSQSKRVHNTFYERQR